MANPAPPAPTTEQSVFAVALVAALLGMAAVVVAPFLSPLAWAVILGHTAWPIHRRLLLRCGGRRTLASLLSTGLVALALVLPMLWALVLLQDDLMRVYGQGQALLAGSTDRLLDRAGAIPGVGPALQDWLRSRMPGNGSVRDLVGDWLRQGSLQLLGLIGGAGRNALKFGFTILFLFFVFRDADALLSRLRKVLDRITGRRVLPFLEAAGHTSRAITLSVVLAAVAQGVVAALGYLVVGLSAPVLLGFVTAMASVVPMFGTFLVWGSISAWLAATGHGWQAGVLLAWGSLLVNPVDNLLRPWIVSSTARLPFLVALLGVLGGLAAFGFVGVFVGPVVLAVSMVLWERIDLRDGAASGAPSNAP